MNPPNLPPWRAYLFVAALAAMLIQAAVFLAIVVLGVPQDVFASPPFRVGVAVAIGTVVVAARRRAHEPLRDAPASRHCIER